MSEIQVPDTRTRTRIAPCDLTWSCEATGLEAASTEDVPPLQGIIGQDSAIDALSFGLETGAPGMNVYVRGLSGTGRMKLVHRLLEDARPACSPAPDRAYVHDFEDPDRPALISLPRGRGRAFRDRIDELARYVREELMPALDSEAMKARRQEAERALHERMKEVGQPFEDDLQENGLAIVMVEVQGGTQSAIVPVIDGKPAPPERMGELIAEGRIEESELDGLRARIQEFGGRLEEVTSRMQELREEHRGQVRTMLEGEARGLVEFSVREIRAAFPTPAVSRFLAGIVEDVIDRQLGALGEGKDLTSLYRVNLLLEGRDDGECPILIETQPSLANLIGTIDRKMLPGGGAYSDHTMVRGGSILRADGGYLVIEAREVLSEPGAWRVLMRTLRTGKLEISATESLLFGTSGQIKPEPIPVNIKVILIGDPGLYYLLDSQDPDFSDLFKVLADFDTTVSRDAESVRFYAGVLSRMVEEEDLPHFEAGAVAALAAHGARIAGRNDRLTTRFGRLADLAREGAFLATKEGVARVSEEHVHEAVRRSRRRGDLPARRFREAIAEGSIRIQTSGEVIGQVNGLAVTQAGPLTYGFPARITTTIGPGHAGTIDIESASQLSGSIHTKGFHILGGLLRHLLRGAGHSLAFSASIAFEQSYGGIDGDSASGAEMCCLLSALTGIPLSQSVAMTGAIDQHGHIQPIGAASEKIEGFFDVCQDAGLNGEQGVIIPAANRKNLVLRTDVVEACEAGQFHVWAVETISQALEIFTGLPAGEPDEELVYPEGSLLQLAVSRAGDFWRQAREGVPRDGAEEETDDEDSATEDVDDSEE